MKLEVKNSVKNDSKIKQRTTLLDNQNKLLEENKNEELGRGKRKKFLPRRLEDFVTDLNKEEDFMAYALNAEEFVDNVSQSYEEIGEREDKETWKKAIQEETTSLIENKTWKLEQSPAGKKVIDNINEFLK